MKLIKDFEQTTSDGVKVIIKIMKREYKEEFPEIIKWKVQIVYKKDKQEIRICRIDNYPHKNVQGCHIHHPNERVTRENLDVVEAKKRAWEIAYNFILNKYGLDIGEPL